VLACEGGVILLIDLRALENHNGLMKVALCLLLASCVGGCCVPQPGTQPMETRIIGKWKAQDGSALKITAINPTSKTGSYIEGPEECKYRILSSNAWAIHLQLSGGGLGMTFDKGIRDICFDENGRMRVTSHITLNLFPTHVVYTRQ
jgi:hypothetical protein